MAWLGSALVAAGCGTSDRGDTRSAEALRVQTPPIGQKVPAETRLAWRVGEIDYRFGISEQQVRDAIAKATRIWEQEAGHDLFYEDASGLPVNLVFDERQENVARRRQAQQRLDELRDATEEAMSAARAKVKEHNEQAQALSRRNEEFQEKLDRHNASVAELNRRGALSDEAAGVDRESDVLHAVRDELNRAQADLEVMARTAQRMKDAADETRRAYNASVDDYNANYAGKMDRAGEFVKSTDGRGRVVSRSINIFEIENLDSLAVVLAHEFGHSLGIQHVAGNGSLMSETYTGVHGKAPPLRLSKLDQAALAGVLAERNVR